MLMTEQGVYCMGECMDIMYVCRLVNTWFKSFLFVEQRFHFIMQYFINHFDFVFYKVPLYLSSM